MSRFKLKKRGVRRIIILLIILVIGGALVLSRGSNQPERPQNIESVIKRDVERIISLEGKIQGRDEREVYLPTGSKVLELRVSESQQVDKDSVIYLVETINSFGNKTNQEVKTPISGQITKLNYKVGDSVLGQTSGFQVVDRGGYILESEVNEVDAIYVKKDQSAKVTIPAISLEEKYNATVSNVAQTPNTSLSINYAITLQPESLPENIRLGMSVDIEILTEKVEDVLAVPEIYLIEKDDKYFVKVFSEKDNGIFEINEVEVEIGLRTSDFVEIKRGIPENTKIVEPEYTLSGSFGFF